MSQNARGDLERGNNPEGNQTRLAPNRPSKEPSFGDSSGPFFSMYSNAAEDEDNQMVKSWQNDADGILIFTGLFSAAVAALLGVTVQDLRPNSQDTSAFYLGNIYEVLADPNATRASVPSPTAKPPPFSAPRYAVWVNSLWFLSLVMSLSCALWATSLQQWARRYIRLTQPARRSPEKRARMRAFYASGVEKMHIPWAVEGLPTLLHLSLFLFFAGLAIFLFSVDVEVFTPVVCWIGLFLTVYGLITLLPLLRQDSPYYTPLSKPAWFLYASIPYVTFTVLAFIVDIFDLIRFGRDRAYQIQRDVFWRLVGLKYRYHSWISGGMETTAEETAEEQSSEIDVHILGWTIGSIGDDDSLEEFFGAIPGLFNSKLVEDLETNFPDTLLFTFWDALHTFMDRTLSSNSITDPVKSLRVMICKDIMSIIPRPFTIVPDPLSDFFDQEPVSIEKLQVMTRWRTHTSTNVSNAARIRVAKSLAKIQNYDDRWIALASDVYGLSESYLQQNVGLGGNNVFLATLIDICSGDFGRLGLIEALTEFDIRHTLPSLQHDFCTLWNKFVQEENELSNSVWILRQIRQLYISLHQGTDAAPTAFSASTDHRDPILLQRSSYPLCDIAGHRTDYLSFPSSSAVPLLTQPVDPSDALLHHSTSGGGTGLQHLKQASTTGPSSPSDPPTSSQIGNSSRGAVTTEPTLLSHASLHPIDAASSGALATAQDIFQDAMMSQTLEGTAHIVAAGAVFASSPFLADSSDVSSSIPAFHPLSHIPPFPNSESPALLGGMIPSLATGDATLPRLRARGLANTENMCLANAVLQLLVHSPPFWNLYRDMKEQHGAGGPDTDGGATPLVDAIMRFFEEFVFKEKDTPPSQQPLQQAAKESLREDRDEEKKEIKVVDSFEPTYMYEAIREKRELKPFLDGKHGGAEQFLGLYLDALDEELVGMHNMCKPSSVPSIEELEEKAPTAERQTKVGKRDNTASSVESPISRIFGGSSRLKERVPIQPDAVPVKAWRSLQLNIQPNSVHTIQDALAHASQPQPVPVGQSYSNEASQQVLLKTLPPILVLHLDRFQYDEATEGIVKTSKPVQFPPELEIPHQIMAPVVGNSAEPMHYKLHGVLYHHGESASSGRYTVDVLHLNGESGSGEVWFHSDDGTVSTVQHKDVFGGHDNERVDDRCAYMLFYCRTASSQT